MTPSDKCTAMVKQFEGCEKKQGNGTFKAYPDPASGGAPWTVGFGATGPDIRPDTIWTQAQCDARLAQDLARFGREVETLLHGAATTQNQFDALCDFVYNLGAANLASSTLLKKHKAGDYVGAADEFPKWNHGGGHTMPGLTKRREAEAQLYRSA